MSDYLRRLNESAIYKTVGIQMEFSMVRRDDLKALIAENESLRKDAERYRWIKKESELSSYEDSYALPIVHAWEYKPGPELNEQFASLDDAIDYVIKSSPENPS